MSANGYHSHSNGNANGNGNGREKVTFPINVPVELALAYPTGKPCKSRYNGDEYMFTLTDGRVMYLEPSPAERIMAEGIRAHEPISITRTSTRQGNHNIAGWELRRLRAHGVSRGVAPPPAPAAPPAETDLEASLKESLRQRGIEPGPEIGESTAPVHEPTTSSCQLRPQNSTLTEALHAAIDAAIEAEAYARTRHNVRFTTEDVRAIAITLFINRMKGGLG